MDKLNKTVFICGVGIIWQYNYHQPSFFNHTKIEYLSNYQADWADDQHHHCKQ